MVASQKRYESFVSEKSTEEINQILGRKKLPSVLGSEKFVNSVKTNFFPQELDEEVPESSSLAPDPKRIKDEVCKALGVDRLDQIGKKFGMPKYSSVSSARQRMKTEISTNRKLRKHMALLIAAGNPGMPGHYYRDTPVSTISREMQTNPYLTDFL